MARAPRDVAASVRTRLFERATTSGEDFQLVLTRYAVERLLYRLSVSRYREDFLVKGAMLFLVWTGQVYRPTRDLDLLGRGDNDPKHLIAVFREICRGRVEEDGLVFLDKDIKAAPIREDAEYEGVRLTFAAQLGQARIPVQVDIAFGDAVSPAPPEVDFPTLLSFKAPRVRIYPAEAVIAEKLQIMVSLGIANSRMKDFSDVWTLMSTGRFEAQPLSDAIAATFERRRTELTGDVPLALTTEFSEDREKQRQWSAFVTRSRIEAPERLADVVAALRDFLHGSASSRRASEAQQNELAVWWAVAGGVTATGPEPSLL